MKINTITINFQCRELYYKNHEGDIEEVSFDYLDDCIKLSVQNDDNELLKRAITTKKLINRYNDELFLSK